MKELIWGLVLTICNGAMAVVFLVILAEEPSVWNAFVAFINIVACAHGFERALRIIRES